MTISKDDLLANEALALQLIGQHCGGAPIGEEYGKDSPHFEPIVTTTWKALADKCYVHLTTIRHFQLTPLGWIKVLEATGSVCDKQMKESLGRLSSALKGRLKGRAEAAWVGTHEIVSETALPHYWVVNVIHSHLIRHCLKRKDADWAPDDRMESTIVVPIDFGHPL